MGSLLTLDQAKTRPSIRFLKGNGIGFWMDFAYWKEIPSDRDFYITGDIGPHDFIDLVADGYGVKDNYGNGSIFVARKDVFRDHVGDAR